MKTDDRIRIQGAGIAGLATALALARHGFRPRIVEQAPDFARVGAGIQISPNGVAILDGLKLGKEARDRARIIRAIRLRNHQGADVLRMDLTKRKRPYLVFHRADLIDLLAEAVQVREQIPVHFGMSPEPVVRDDEILIGADGVRSRVRALVGATKDPVFTGQVAWRALIPDTTPDDEVQVFMGPGRHLVTYSLADGLRNIVAVEERKDWVEDGWSHVDDSGDLKAAFSGFCDEVQGLIASVVRPNIWGLFRRPVAERWHKDRMVLVGDAAHTTLPFLGQGANMALEDAWILAEVMVRTKIGSPFRRFQDERFQRVTRIVATSLANARNYHLSNPVARFVGHNLLRVVWAVNPDIPLRSYDWLYEYDPTTR